MIESRIIIDKQLCGIFSSGTFLDSFLLKKIVIILSLYVFIFVFMYLSFGVKVYFH